MGSRAAAEGAFWADAEDDVILQRYRTLVNTIDDGIYQLDADGHFVAVNDVIVETTGYAREDLLGEHVSLVVDERDLEAIESEIRSHLVSDDRGIVTFELGVETASGERVPCELRINLLTDGDEFQGTIGVVRDVTEERRRLRSLESVQASYESMSNVLDEADIGVFVLDSEFEVAWVDETIEEYLGLEREAVLGRDKREVVEESVKDKLANPDSFARNVLATYDDNSYVEQFECRVTGGDDLEERWLQHQSKPIESGQYAGGRIELYYDITDRKHSEDALEQRRAEFDSLVDAVEDYAIFRLDAAGHVVSWNRGAEEIKGYDRDEILGEHFSTFYTEADRADGVPERNLSAAADAGSVEDEGWRVRADGTRFWASVTITALEGDDGTPRGYLKVTRDMTERYEREQELESELQTILNRISDAFYAVDDEFRFTHVNERAEELLEHTEEELLGERIWTVFPSTSGLDEVWEAFHTARETQEATSYELYYDDLDFWVEANLYPSETGISVYFRDVTERKEREQALEESERRYRTLAEYFPNGFVTLFDDDLEYTLAAGQGFDRIPVAPEDLEGRKFHDVWPAEVVRELEPGFTAALAGEERSTELEYADREWVFHAVPITDERGEVFAGMTMAQDITEQKERQRALAERERQLSTLMDNVPGMVYRCRNERGWPMEFVSDACEEITGYEPEALESGEVSFGEDVMVDADREEVWTELQRTVDDREPYSMTYRIETADGEVRWVRSDGRGVFEDGDLVILEGIISDVTERKRLETELKESNERLEQFAYAASHDLQEPLRMVTSYLQLIENRYAEDLDEDGREFIEFAVDGADRMRDMIDGLLAYSRVETRGDPLEPVDLDEVFADVREDLQVQIEESDADITAESLPRVRGDASQLRQVFQNLLSNAITYSGDDPPRVHVSATRRGRTWEVSVRDEGIGIHPEDQDRIFTVFDRLHAAGEYEGTGIGLALCERIVERHGGDIRVESEPGEGSTFTFTVPAVE